MKCNVGKCDRNIRFLIGLLIFGVGYYFKSWWGAIGLIPIITALLGWCPAYGPFGINTCKDDKCCKYNKLQEKPPVETNKTHGAKFIDKVPDDDPGVYDDSDGDM